MVLDTLKSEGKGSAVLYSAPNVVREMDGFYLVVNPEIPNMMVVDEIGHKILELCKENVRRSYLVKKISAEFDCVEEDVEHFIESLTDSKFIAENAPPYLKDEKKPLKLESLQLHLTQACNLRCRHCYYSSGIPFKDELTDDEYLDFVRGFKEIGLVGFTLTGGEPFLRKDLVFKLLEEAALQGIDHISLSTNGTLLTEDDAALLKRQNVKVGVSLDGATAKTHDYIRGKGVFNKAIKALKILREAGVHTTIGWTLMKANIKEAEKVLYLAKDLGVNGVYFNTVRIRGRARENIKDTEIPAEDSFSCLMQLWKTSRELGVRTTAEARFDSLKEFRRKDLCGAGKAVLCIAANGDVYPCDAFLGARAFKAGNIRKEPVIEIWRKSSALEPFRNIHVDDVEGCSDCELKYICGGGCIEDNYEAHGTLTKVSPACPVLKGICEEMMSKLAKEMWSKQQ